MAQNKNDIFHRRVQCSIIRGAIIRDFGRTSLSIEDRNSSFKFLDYYCGSGLDADMYGMQKYDPVLYPDEPDPADKFNLITWMFGPNKVRDALEETLIIYKLIDMLTPDGNLYISYLPTKTPGIKDCQRTTSGFRNTGLLEEDVINAMPPTGNLLYNYIRGTEFRDFFLKQANIYVFRNSTYRNIKSKNGRDYNRPYDPLIDTPMGTVATPVGAAVPETVLVTTTAPMLVGGR